MFGLIRASLGLGSAGWGLEPGSVWTNHALGAAGVGLASGSVGTGAVPGHVGRLSPWELVWRLALLGLAWHCADQEPVSVGSSLGVSLRGVNLVLGQAQILGL